MQRLKDMILSTDFTMSIFVLIGLRVAIVGGSSADALAIAAICGLQGFYKWNDNNLLLKKQAPLNEKVEKDLQDIRSAMTGLHMKNSIRPTVNASNEPVTPIKFF